MVPLARVEPGAAQAAPRSSVRQINFGRFGASVGAIPGRKPGETQSISSHIRKNLRPLDVMNLGAVREITREIVPQPIRGPRADRRLERRSVARNPEEIRFKALVATIQQRDAADRRATNWERAFFRLAWTAGTASAALVLAWLKGWV